MDSRSPIKDRSQGYLKPRGFTLLELMLAVVISSFVFAGVLSAYIFLGRALTRQGNEAEQESRSRLTLFYLTQEVSSATGIAQDTNPPTTTSGITQMVINTLDGNGSPYTVTYSYNASAGGGTLTRAASTGAGPTSLLVGVTNLTFSYYNSAGTPLTSALNPTITNPNIVKQINLSYTTVSGTAVSGAQSHFSVISPLIVMKNKPLLQ
jgi:prepilin-type N-terminal cleavage/methylation domain-containing protein